MKTLTIYGSSDDLLETSGVKGCDEFNVNPDPNGYAGYLKVVSGDIILHIHVIYDGSWAFSVCPQNGDCDEMPKWDMMRSFGSKSSYSETLTIEVPDDTKLKYVKTK